MSGGSGLLPTDLTGFSFKRLGELNTWGSINMGDEPADWQPGR